MHIPYIQKGKPTQLLLAMLIKTCQKQVFYDLASLLTPHLIHVRQPTIVNRGVV